MKKLFWLALAAATLAPLAAVPAHATSNPPEFTVCNASACITYWNVGTATSPVWIIVNIEPIIPGERNVD